MKKTDFKGVILSGVLRSRRIFICICILAASFALSACDDSSSASNENDNGETSALSSSVIDAGSTDVSSSSVSLSGTSAKTNESTMTESSDSNSSEKATKPGHSSNSSEVSGSSIKANVMPSGTYDCTKYNCSSTKYLNQELLKAGEYSEILDSRDGNVYKVVKIGNQWWMAQNLNFKYSKYKNEQKIYGNYTDVDGGDEFGRYYTWAAAMDSAAIFTTNASEAGMIANEEEWEELRIIKPARGICPEGWHIPAPAEWETLVDAVEDPYALQAEGNEAWHEAENESGFSAIPAESYHNGRFVDDFGDDVGPVRYNAYFWTSSKAGFGCAGSSDGGDYGCTSYASSMKINVHNAEVEEKRMCDFAISIRCVKDSE